MCQKRSKDHNTIIPPQLFRYCLQYWQFIVSTGDLWEIVPLCKMSCRAYLFLLMSLFSPDLIPLRLYAMLCLFDLNPVLEWIQLCWQKYSYLLKFSNNQVLCGIFSCLHYKYAYIFCCKSKYKADWIPDINRSKEWTKMTLYTWVYQWHQIWFAMFMSNVSHMQKLSL